MKRQYELTLVFSPVLSPEKREEAKKKILGAAKIASSDDLGALDLAYPIKKQTKGYFLRLSFETAPEEILKMKENLKITDGILRYLLIKN